MKYFGEALHAQLLQARHLIKIDIEMGESEVADLTKEHDRVSAKLYANRCRLEHLEALIGPDQQEPPL